MITEDVLTHLRAGATVPLIARDLGLPESLVRSTTEQLVRLGLAHRAVGCGVEGSPCAPQKTPPSGGAGALPLGIPSVGAPLAGAGAAPKRTVPLACRGCPFAR